jgi:putative FmdB family regulatory protein
MVKSASKNAIGTAMPHSKGSSMPTYDYFCDRCEEQIEITLTLEAASQTMICHCSKPLRKVYSPTPAHFKGEGWAGKTN